MKKLSSFKYLVTLILGFSILFGQDLSLPNINESDQIIQHSAYTLNYDEQHEQASWVAYILTSTHIRGTFNRTNDFREDYKVKTGSASLSDYKGSGYDRGHLAPAGDMKWSSTAMSESFFMSNMSPQMAFDARFNGDMKYAFESGEIKVMNTSDNLTISYDVVIDARSAIIM